jgi:hypothetical protein
MNVPDALRAICTTGEGHCWYCDEQLPNAEVAIRTGWDVKRLEGERVASIILICPTCDREKQEMGEEEFLRNFSQRALNTAEHW